MTRLVVAIVATGTWSLATEAQISNNPPFETRVVFDTSDSIPSVDAPILNEAGQLAFTKSLGVSDFQVIRYGLDGQLTTIFARDQILPSGSTLVELPYFTFAASGHILAYTVVLPTGATQELADVHQYTPGTGIVDILPTSDPFGTAPFKYLYLPSQNDLGQVVISAQVDRPNSAFDDYLLYMRDTNGLVHELARTGDATATPGEFLDYLSTAIVNDRADITFRGTLVDSSGTDTGSGSFRTSAGNPIEKLSMSAINLNNLGGLGGKVNSTPSGEKIVIKPNAGPWQTLVQTGDAFGGATFSDFDGTTDFNDQQQVLFQAELTSLQTTNPPPPSNGLFIADPDGVTILARIGDSVPVTVPGVALSIDRFLQMDLNNNGQAAFAVQMQDGNFNFSKALFLYDPINGLELLAHEGQSFEGGTITDLSFAGGTNYGNEGSGFNDRGEVAWAYTLDNGEEGIALYTNRPLIPEPSSLALLGLGGLLLARRRRG